MASSRVRPGDLSWPRQDTPCTARASRQKRSGPAQWRSPTDAAGLTHLAPGRAGARRPRRTGRRRPDRRRGLRGPQRGLAVLGVTGTSGKTTTTYLLRAGLQAAGRVCGLIGTVATPHRRGHDQDRLHHPRGARATGAARRHARARRGLGGDGGVQPCAGPRTRRRHRLRRRRVLQSLAGPPGLPRRHGRLLRCEGPAVRRTVPHRSGGRVDDEWGRRLVGPADGHRHHHGARHLARLGRGHRSNRTYLVPGASARTSTCVRAAPSRVVQRGERPARAGDARQRRGEPVDRRACGGHRRGARSHGARRGGAAFLAVVDYSHKPAAVAGALHALAPADPRPPDHRPGLRRRPRPGESGR